jgi:hypothetical protein
VILNVYSTDGLKKTIFPYFVLQSERTCLNITYAHVQNYSYHDNAVPCPFARLSTLDITFWMMTELESSCDMWNSSIQIRNNYTYKKYQVFKKLKIQIDAILSCVWLLTLGRITILYTPINAMLPHIIMTTKDLKKITVLWYCHVLGVSVTNNNGFWIWWLGLLALLCNYSWI